RRIRSRKVGNAAYFQIFKQISEGVELRPAQAYGEGVLQIVHCDIGEVRAILRKTQPDGLPLPCCGQLGIRELAVDSGKNPLLLLSESFSRRALVGRSRCELRQGHHYRRRSVCGGLSVL